MRGFAASSSGRGAAWDIPLTKGKAALAAEGGNVVNRLTGQQGALMNNGGDFDCKTTWARRKKAADGRGMANIWRAGRGRGGRRVNLARNEAFTDGATARRLQPKPLESNPGTDALEEGREA